MLIFHCLIIFLLVPMEFLQFGFIWIVIGISLIFHLSAKTMLKILEPLEELAQSRK